jgi:hypothetical protein
MWSMIFYNVQINKIIVNLKVSWKSAELFCDIL